MSDADVQEPALERYRAYLQLIARLEADHRFLGKLDISGVVQQTLLEAHHACAQIAGAPDIEIKKWLRSILAHNLIDEVRRLGTQARDVKRERSLETALEESSARLEKWLVADVSSPSDRLNREEQLSRLAQALAQIPADQRLAVELHHLREMPLADVAKFMERSRGAVASLIFRGLQSIRKIMDHEPGS